jgi:hypothetical protein
VSLPDEVIATMEARAWQVPVGAGGEVYRPVDESFWVRWSAQRATADVGLLDGLIERVGPNAASRARRREVEQDYLFYCQVCGARRVKLHQHHEEALCSDECRRRQIVAVAYFTHKSWGVVFSDREVLEGTGLPVSALPRRLRCKWCGQATLDTARGWPSCSECGGGNEVR